jgi:hypothetical protein
MSVLTVGSKSFLRKLDSLSCAIQFVETLHRILPGLWQAGHRALACGVSGRYLIRMPATHVLRAIPCVIAVVLAVPAVAGQKAMVKPAVHKAAAHPAGGPTAIGTFGNWTAATEHESGQTVCYAFTRAAHSRPALPGRGQVVLTVTERPKARDEVAISAGFTYHANAEVRVLAGERPVPFYVVGRDAFARDGAAAVAEMEKAGDLVARSPAPKGKETVVDTFSLGGFDKAYKAISEACPPT